MTEQPALGKSKSLTFTDRCLYAKIHHQLRKENPKTKVCEFCGTTKAKRYEWALKKGHDYSTNIEDYFELCMSCHRKYDNSDYHKQALAERTKKKKGKLFDRYKKVVRIDEKGNETIFESITQAGELYNKNRTGAISNCLAGRSHTAYGCKWRYYDGQ
jgi:hypothetical protein